MQKTSNTSKQKEIRSILFLIILVGLGLTGNFVKINLFFNVDFLFGSIATMLILYLYRAFWGITAAILFSIITIFTLGHPYALILFVLEALFVVLILHRRSDNLVILVTIYWTILGIPLAFVFEYFLISQDWYGAFLIAFKFGVNGIFNALIAAIIIGNLHYIRKWIPLPSIPRTISFHQLLFNILVSFVIIPLLGIMVLINRNEINKIDTEIQRKLEITSVSTEHILRSWLDENLQHLRSLAGFAGNVSNITHLNLQEEVELVQSSDLDFTNMAICNVHGTIVAYAPMRNLNDHSKIGKQISKIPQYSQLKRKLKPVVTNLFSSEVMNAPPNIAMAAPIIIDSKFNGYAIGFLNLTHIQNTILDVTQNWDIDVVVTDKNAAILMSSHLQFHYGKPFKRNEEGYFQKVASGVKIWLPDIDPSASHMDRWKQSIYIKENNVSKSAGWTVILEASVEPYLQPLYIYFIIVFIIIIALILLIILLSSLVSRGMVNSLHQLQRITTNLSEKISRQHEVKWPSTMLFEVMTLILNFKSMARVLSEQFSELEQAKDAAESANRMKNIFLANISHEIRTPLNATLGYAQILLKETGISNTQQDGLKMIQRSGNHLLGLIEDILDLSKVEAGKMVLHPVPFLIHPFLQEMDEITRFRAQEKGLTFQLITETWLPEVVMGDEKRLRQVLLNILGNAIKYTDEGHIVCRIAYQEEKLRVQVDDTGIGIPTSDQEQIFLSFHQGEAATNRDGTGLGLAISQRLVHLMGGRIHVESEVGKGSSFWFQIPLPSTQKPEKRLDLVESQVIGYEGERINILVIDDHHENREILLKMLQPLGFQISLASSGVEGLDKLATVKPHVILLDLVLPDMPGEELLDRMRTVEVDSFPIVIAVSADTTALERLQKTHPIEGYLSKPFQESTLLRLLEQNLPITLLYRNDEEIQTTPDQQDYQSIDYPNHLPHKNLIRQLYEYADDGNITAIYSLINQLNQRDTTTSLFIQRVQQYATGFQLKKLKHYLETILDSNGETFS